MTLPRCDAWPRAIAARADAGDAGRGTASGRRADAAVGDSRLPARSQLHRLLAPEAFVWATGIEDTFIAAPSPRSGRTLDEYELTGHYQRWQADLDLAAGLGVRAMRYGVPWHRVNPGPGRWEWEWADRPLERLLALGIDPVVDLVHYGVPPWIAGGSAAVGRLAS